MERVTALHVGLVNSERNLVMMAMAVDWLWPMAEGWWGKW